MIECPGLGIAEQPRDLFERHVLILEVPKSEAMP